MYTISKGFLYTWLKGCIYLMIYSWWFNYKLPIILGIILYFIIINTSPYKNMYHDYGYDKTTYYYSHGVVIYYKPYPKALQRLMTIIFITIFVISYYFTS